jgi:hypothetical protein
MVEMIWFNSQSLRSQIEGVFWGRGTASGKKLGVAEPKYEW